MGTISGEINCTGKSLVRVEASKDSKKCGNIFKSMCLCLSMECLGPVGLM